jgi:uncharacterized membrane protein YeaQ/YmgE (transglycosylase-associated protein family)
MPLVGLLVLLVIGVACGAMAELVLRARVGGVLASAALGFIGALVGAWVAEQARLPGALPVRVDGSSMDALWSALGAIAVLFLVTFARRAAAPRAPL